MFSSKSKSKAWISKGIFLSFVLWMLAKLLQSYLALCDPTDYSPPNSSVQGILQASILEWLPCPPPGDLPDPGMESKSLTSPALAGRIFTTKCHQGSPFCFLLCMRARSLQLCPTLCNLVDCSSPGSSVHGILQVSILEWIAMPCSRGSSWPRAWTLSQASPESAGGFFTTRATWNDSK